MVEGAPATITLPTVSTSSEVQTGSLVDADGVPLNEVNDGTVLYIDPNDPQAAALLQQAGLTLVEDGTVQNIASTAEQTALETTTTAAGTELLAAGNDFDPTAAAASVMGTLPKQEMITLSAVHEVKSKDVEEETLMSVGSQPTLVTSLEDSKMILSDQLQSFAQPLQPEMPKTITTTARTMQDGGATSASSITVGPDQQQVFYSVTYEDGKTQQYMMLCPKEMDQNALIQTLVKQISADPSAKGKKTIRIQKPAGNKVSGAATSNKQPIPKFPSRVAEPRARGRPPVNKSAPVQQLGAPSLISNPDKIGDILSAASTNVTTTVGLGSDVQNVVDQSEAFESVAQPDPTTGELMTSPESGGTRVYVRCFYCTQFKSTLNSDTWEAILNHILPVCKEEIQTTFYGDLGKHFIRCVRMQVNGKQVVRSRTLSGEEKRTPQCEVILTHSLVCRKTKVEFVVSNPDAAFVANLAKHIRMIQPGQGGRGNSLLCIFCNSPFTYEDYLRHIQPHLDQILATLSCFAGAYCASSYDTTIRATTHCQTCQEPEPADLRFLPCTKFSTEYRCLTKLQFAIECFRENYGDSGYMRLNTSNLAKCSVCKNPQAVYCAVFHITTNVLGGAAGGTEDIDTTLSVCVNCQKQFINIVMKEQGFEERLKVFQLRNMEQLCSCLRVILGQAKQVCDERKVLLYTVDEGATNQTSAVHTVKTAEVAQLAPITRLLSLAETDIKRAPVKAFFICDLCLFTVDLTSLIVAPGPSSNPQKNDMLLSIVLEHLIPHTESLMTVVASSAANRTINIKFELMARISDIPNQGGARKIVLSLQKKFKSQTSAMEVLIEKDEEKTMAQIRAGIKAERKQYVSVRPSTTSVQNNPSTPANATQLIDVNKFVEQQRGKLGILAQCGCNTSLLNAYTECRLCSKFCFPDFRLAGNPGIELCENCVETVLTLCLPTDPEHLEVAEECLALRQDRSAGHRLVLQNHVKKWLSVDGVAIIKKTVESFDNVKSADCGSFFTDALKQHLVANLKTCHNDPEIMSAVTGFCVTDQFFTSSKVHSEEAKADEETAAALASLSAQIGMPIRQAGGGAVPSKPGSRQKQIEVKILSRRPATETAKRPPLQLQRMPQRGAAAAATTRRVISNGMVIDLGSAGPKKVISTPNKTIHLPSSTDADRDEESVMAIQKFLDSTSGKQDVSMSEDLKVPSGVKITNAGKGVVNIRAVSDTKSTPKGRGGRVLVATPVKDAKPTITSPSIVRRSDLASPKALAAADSSRKTRRTSDVDADDSDVDEDALRELEDAFEEEEAEEAAAKNAMNGGRPGPKSKARPAKKIKDEDFSPKKTPEKKRTTSESAETPTSETRSKRQRKEKKIFDL